MEERKEIKTGQRRDEDIHAVFTTLVKNSLSYWEFV
jgi:hypothetical protein